MGHSKWIGAFALVGACYFAGQMIAQEPTAEDPFGGSDATGTPVVAASDDPFGGAASGAPPAVRDAPDPFAVERTASSSEPEVSDNPRGSDQRGAKTDDPGASSAQRRIEAALNQRLKAPLDFPQTPLNVVLQVLSEEFDIPIQFDTKAMDAVAQPPDIEISANYHGITLRSALELMLGQVEDLTYIIDNEVLLITSIDEAESRLLTLVYQVDDLLPHGSGTRGEGNTSTDAPIVDVITRCVERDSWARTQTGDGEICVLEPGVMVISQTQRVHNEVARLLAEIRRAKAAIEDRPPGGF